MASALLNGFRCSVLHTSQSFLRRNFHSLRIDPIAKTVSKEIERNPLAFGGCSLLNQCWAYFSGLNVMSVRTHIRIHFPKPCERKRVERHGWKKRMSTPAGKKILMNRILKGRHVLSH